MGEMTLDHFCRLCLKETFTLSNIFSQRSASGDPVYKTLNFLYDLEICQDDGLPTQICAPCLWRMIEFEAYKKNVHCAKDEILKLFGKTKEQDEIFEGECNEHCGEEVQVQLEDAPREFDEEDPVETYAGTRKEAEIPYARHYAEEQSTAWLLQQRSVDQLPSTLKTHRHQPLSTPHQMVQPTQQIYAQGPKVSPEWPHIPKDISVRPICSAASRRTQRIPEGYLSQSGVHFLAGALMTNEKPVSNEIASKDNLEATSTKSSSSSQSKEVNFEVFVKQEVGEEADMGGDLRTRSIMGFQSRPESREQEGLKDDLGGGTFAKKREAFICDVCRKSYSLKVHLGQHMKTQHGKRRQYLCRVCGERFQQSRARGRHELLHLKEEVKKEKPHTCHTCGKQFSSKSSYYRHCNEHTDKYACPTCGKSFSCSKDLKRHTIIHSNEKPFQCGLCLRAFNQKGNLNKHMVTHSMERPFDCHTCHRKFKTKRERNNHELTHLRRQAFMHS